MNREVAAADTRELIEAREQLAATSEILRAINASRDDAQPVMAGLEEWFDTPAAAQARAGFRSGHPVMILVAADTEHIALTVPGLPVQGFHDRGDVTAGDPQFPKDRVCRCVGA